MIRLLVVLAPADERPALSDLGPGVEIDHEAPLSWGDIVLALDRFEPDIVLLWRAVPGYDAISVASDILRVAGDRVPAVIILAETYADGDVMAAARAGVRGYVVGEPCGGEWNPVVRAVASGEGWLSPVAAGDLLKSVRQVDPPENGAQAVVSLTERELSVVRLLAGGCSNLEIADELGLSQSTIKTHVSRMLTKLDLRSRTQLAAFARDAGIV
ncbi:LuxR C-terminal-related transcriptional regulator [Amycolatopsis sp. NPDC049868]|uniref:response regulator transcription factor n=1 Tax=Amycolatopsis sp. NPDC049868 TaxID=3363934 RepID=UPI0037B367FB